MFPQLFCRIMALHICIYKLPRRVCVEIFIFIFIYNFDSIRRTQGHTAHI